MGPQKGTTHDLAILSDLDESTLIDELHHRYKKNVIYTYIGDILISVNPYKDIPLYGEEVGRQYAAARTLKALPPHIYAIGARAFHNLQHGQGNQCLLVSGESGAGKTEVTKMLVAQIVRMSQWEGDFYLQEKIIEVNPVLEAFGNARTMMNDNSSRFGKLIEVVFSEEGAILGATITEHMLEKSRVIHQSLGEANFHIFYNVMCGFSPEERKRYFLEAPEKYRIIDPGHGTPVIRNAAEFAGYKESMDNLRRIMPIVGFSRDDMDVVFAILAAVLHLCNIEMANDPESEEVIVMNEDELDYAAVLHLCNIEMADDPESEEVIVMNEDELGYAAVLLSVKAEDLISCLLANINWLRGERFMIIKNLHQAVDGRDALAKALYCKLFSWIVQQINFMLHEDESRSGSRSVISILDMAGFENFPENSFEQLCINGANERLQYYFNEHIFSQELREYQSEGIKQPKIKFTNNDDVLHLLFQRPMGLFSLLEEECRLARANDMTMVEKFNKQFAKVDLYKKSKHHEPVFAVAHYAGIVTYRAVGFIEKNRDTLSSNMQKLMEQSHNKLVSELFTAKVMETGTLDMRHGSGRSKWSPNEIRLPEKRQYAPGDSLSRQAGKKLKQKLKESGIFQDIGITANPHSASAHFKNSLQLLMDKLQKAEPQFIRCIKPNHSKLPHNFEVKVVADQLRSTGVLETTRIRRLGYATRLSFQMFLLRYKILAFPLTSDVEAGPASCMAILRAAKLKDAQIGNNKVFLKYWHTDILNAKMDNILMKIVQIQSMVRTYLAQRNFLYALRLQKQQAEQLEVFSGLVELRCETAYNQMVHCQTHDGKRAVKMNNHTVQQSPVPDRSPSSEMPDVFTPDYPLESESERFYQEAVNQVVEKFHDIDPDVWCKILYMEYGKTVAKFYICDKEVVIDGSTEEFTGRRVGLGAFSNPERDDITDTIRTVLDQGISLRREPDGSISMSRLVDIEVMVKDYQNPANHCLSADVLTNQGRIPSGRSMKIFDMEEFKSHIGIQLRSGQFDEQRLQLLSTVCISFCHDTDDPLLTPCWLCIINLMALDMIGDPDVKKEVLQKFAELSIQDRNEVVEKQALKAVAGKYDRNWSKLNSRQSGKGGREPLRKTRMHIKQRGENVKDRMEYSWADNNNQEPKGRHMNVQELQEEYDRFDEDASFFPDSSRGAHGRAYSIASSAAATDISQPSRKDWAKIRVALKEENKQDTGAVHKTRTRDIS